MLVASENGHVEVVRALLTAGADIVQAKVSEWHRVPPGQFFVCGVLVGVPVGPLPPPPMFLQLDGASPLFMASQNGHAEVLHALLAAGAAVNQTTVCAMCLCVFVWNALLARCTRSA